VINLQDELKQLHYAELNAVFRTLLKHGLATFATASACKKVLTPVVRRFLDALAAQTGTKATVKNTVIEEMTSCLTFLTTLKIIKPSAKPARDMLSGITDMLSVPKNGQLLLAWLLLKGNRIELDLYGLDYSLKHACGDISPEESLRSVQLLEALLANTAVDTKDGVTPIESAFSTVAGRNFMQVHISGETEWFNKERYEELLEWFSIISIMKLAGSKPAARTIAARLGRMASEYKLLTDLASHAGYRTKLLQQLLKPVEEKPKTIGNPVNSMKPARKKTDAQGNTRTQASKTPDNKVPR
jgi:hypothetical protein